MRPAIVPPLAMEHVRFGCDEEDDDEEEHCDATDLTMLPDAGANGALPAVPQCPQMLLMPAMNKMHAQQVAAQGLQKVVARPVQGKLTRPQSSPAGLVNRGRRPQSAAANTAPGSFPALTPAHGSRGISLAGGAWKAGLMARSLHGGADAAAGQAEKVLIKAEKDLMKVQWPLLSDAAAGRIRVKRAVPARRALEAAETAALCDADPCVYPLRPGDRPPSAARADVGAGEPGVCDLSQELKLRELAAVVV